MYEQSENQQGTVQFRWITVGFALSAGGLLLLSLDSTLELAFILSFAPGLRKLLVHPVWQLGNSSLITLITFLGSYALWRRMPTMAWSRASTLLMMMNAAHVGLWLMDHHMQIGLPDQHFEHEWLRLQVSQIFNWLEFLAWVRLLNLWNESLKNASPEDSATKAGATYPGWCWFGLLTSIAIAVGLTDWRGGWPLERIGRLNPMDSLMLVTVTTMLTTAACYHLTFACIKATITARHRLRTEGGQFRNYDAGWYQDEWDDDPWKNR